MKLNYKQKIFVYFLIIFTVFTVSIVVFEQLHAKKYKTEALEEKLDAYADIIGSSIEKNKGFSEVDSLLNYFPQSIRITLVDKQGVVLYDNAFKNLSTLENHSQRPEILKANDSKFGTDIRLSASNSQKYLYFAKVIGSYYVRVALPYDIQVRNFLKSDNLFLYYIILLFIVTLWFIYFVSNRFASSIKGLKDFTIAAETGKIDKSFNFPDDELGEIGAKIAEGYKHLDESKKKVLLEREKLLQHIQSSEEGICFFSAEKSVDYVNSLFIQYLNIIATNTNANPEIIFTDYSFIEIQNFILDYRKKNETYFETQLIKQGKHFGIRVNIFDDNSIEITINDITEQEKTRLLKQQMTSNIAHELRTPITSIRGYLETMLEQNLEPEKQRYFLEKAYKQALNLSELTQDMSLITKIEEAPETFKSEPVNINELLIKIREDLDLQLKESNISFTTKIPDNTVVNGNYRLLYSIFRNLTDNTINHAGNNVNILISTNEDNDFYHFSFADTGKGIQDEKHLNRLFERFYRVNEGRTRESGGTGLGLSIVKNAVLFHKGTIAVKNKQTGGLEFIFSIKK